MKMTTTAVRNSTASDSTGELQHGYRGRVRSGCLTCRSRKVKCDEHRPVCHNCTRLKRSCVYKPKKSRQDPRPPSPHGDSAAVESPDASRHEILSPGTGSVSSNQRTPSIDTDSVVQSCPTSLSEEEGSASKDITSISPGILQDTFLTPDASAVDVTSRLERALRHQNAAFIAAGEMDVDVSTRSTLISRDIELTTTMDILAAREVSPESLFSFFLETVECPPITLYDAINWQRVKREVIELGNFNTAIASAIIAISFLYKGHLYNLPLSRAVSFYYASIGDYNELLYDQTQDFSTVLAATFLLCLFNFFHYETLPILRQPAEKFCGRLEAWVPAASSNMHFCIRIITWLTLLQTSAMRGGGDGLLSDHICSLFSELLVMVPNHPPLSGYPSDASTQIYEMLSAPIFRFYFQLQVISGDIARLTHYRRSRITGEDQKEVTREILHITSRLHILWESRSAAQRQTPEDLRSHLAPRIADPIITLVGICAAAYHVEFVEIGRVHGDPVAESTKAQQSMHQIRDIIDGDWNAYEGGRLNPGYLRPLFIYAIECMDRSGSQWAVEKMGHIKNPICRSNFFAAFGKALSDAQVRKKRRMTSKYFCVRYFGVPPPYM